MGSELAHATYAVTRQLQGASTLQSRLRHAYMAIHRWSKSDTLLEGCGYLNMRKGEYVDWSRAGDAGRREN